MLELLNITTRVDEHNGMVKIDQTTKHQKHFMHTTELKQTVSQFRYRDIRVHLL